MPTVIGVRFKSAGKIYYFSPDDLAITTDDCVIVETSRGVEYGEVVIAPREVSEEEIVPPLKNVIRIATAEDKEKIQLNHQKFWVGVCFAHAVSPSAKRSASSVARIRLFVVFMADSFPFLLHVFGKPARSPIICSMVLPKARTPFSIKGKHFAELKLFIKKSTGNCLHCR